MAETLNNHEVGHRLQVGPLLEQIEEPLAAFVADGTCNQSGETEAVAEHTLDTAVIVPAQSTA